MRAPDLLEPIGAWRVWAVEHDAEHGLVLTSLHMLLRWKPDGYVVAGCRMPRQAAPVPHDHPCQCGIHAAKTWEGAVGWLPRHIRVNAPTFVVKPTSCLLGRVLLSGQVVEHERGYRAEKARPAELFVPHLFKLPSLPVYAQEARERLGDVYGVPARVVRRFDETELGVAA